MDGYVTKFVPREQYDIVRGQLIAAINAVERYGVDSEEAGFDVLTFASECRAALRKAQEMEI